MSVIKSIKATGFKSFAKPTELIFGRDFSGIIGPNGSGKSNVIDLVCFVLGRLSAKSLRAEKSANLIYNGGKNGKPAKQAEATIVFDNSEKKFPIDAKEIELKRVLRNTGMSKYYINNELRTRQQILDMLRPAKIDPDGHNIVLQGDITQVAEMAADDRKKVLEDISGISVYEDKKEKGVRELDRVQERLNEANIVLIERETYLKELKKDRDSALKYKDLEKNINRNKATFLHVQIKNKEDQLTNVNKKINLNKENVVKINEVISKIQDEIANKKSLIEKISRDVEEKAEQQQVSLQNEITQVKDTISHNNARLESLKLEIERIKERKKQLKIDAEQTDEKDSVLQKQKLELETELNKLKDNRKELDDKIEKIKPSKVDKELDEKINKRLDEDSSLAIQLGSARDKYAKFSEKLAILKARQASQNETQFGNRALASIKKLNLKGVFGTIAELSVVEEKYSLALEIAAGPRLHSVVVENEDIASKCINYLKKNRLGTAVFLPLNKIKSNLSSNKRIGHGLAINLVQFDGRFRKAFEYVFGSTLVIDNLNEAKRIGIGKIRMVTLEGDLVETSGAMIGGYRKKKSLFRNLDQDLDKAKEELERLSDVMNTLENRRMENDKLITELKQEIAVQSENEELKELEGEKQKLTENMIIISSDLKNLDMQINEILNSEKDSIVKIIKQHDHELNEFEKEIEDLSKIVSHSRAELKEKEKLASKFYSKYRESFNEKDKLGREVQKIELRINDNENKIAMVEERINNLNLDRAKVVSELEGLKEEFVQFKDVGLRKGIPYEQLKDEIYKFEALLKNMGNVNLRALEIYEDVEKEYNNLQIKVDKLKNEREDVLKMIEEIESRKTGVFMKTFNAMSSNFERIFSQLTVKGTAHLILENPEKPLEGGVRILVRISSDRFLDIKSLSGGEKTLTALAFIFSIQEYEPASFYVLDEVDAALDKQNSEMLANFLENYSKRAQYIVISHNDAVISAATQLYGVSMRENGISNVVSLKV